MVPTAIPSTTKSVSTRTVLLYVASWSRALGRGALISLLILPFVIGGLDHHGAERIPTHLHWPDPGAAGSIHTHGFESPHDHAAALRPAGFALALPTTPAVLDPDGGLLGSHLTSALVSLAGGLVLWLAAGRWGSGRPAILPRPESYHPCLASPPPRPCPAP